MKPSFVQIVCAVVWLMALSELPGQTRVRLAVLSEGNRPVGQLRLVVSGASLPVETQSNGECWLDFPPGSKALSLYPPDEYEMVSPPDGQVLVPEDKTQTVRIWVSKRGRSEDRNLRLYIDVTAQKEREKERLAIETASLKKQLADIEINRRGETLRTDSLRAVLERQQSRSDVLTREVTLLKEKIDLKKPLLFAGVSSELLFYVDKLKDLRDVLPRTGRIYRQPHCR